MTHRLPVRVYYEDTDLAGIVYYANYLRFIERGRSEWLRDRGIHQSALRSDADIVFAVTRVEADYLAPARFDDLLRVETRFAGHTAARLIVDQVVARDETPLFRARVTLACLSGSGRAVRIPDTVLSAIADA